jgi:hypothetical protein
MYHTGYIIFQPLIIRLTISLKQRHTAFKVFYNSLFSDKDSENGVEFK